MKSSSARGLGQRLWPGGVVPYVISRELGKNLIVKDCMAFQFFDISGIEYDVFLLVTPHEPSLMASLPRVSCSSVVEHPKY